MIGNLPEVCDPEGGLMWLFLPSNLQEGLKRYIEEHIETGSFLRAVLENDLILAVRRADPVSREYVSAIATFLIEAAPARCYGSKEAVESWIGEKPEVTA